MSTERWITVTVLLIVLLSVPAAAALSIDKGTQFQADNGFTVEAAQDIKADSVDYPAADTVSLSPFSATGVGSEKILAYNIYKDQDYTKVGDLNGSSNTVVVRDANGVSADINSNVTTFSFRRSSPYISLDDGIVDFMYETVNTPDITIDPVVGGTGICAYDDNGNRLDCARSTNGGEVTFDSLPTGTKKVYLRKSEAPILSNTKPSGFIQNRGSVDFSVDVDDGDFPDDSVTVEIKREGNITVGTQTVSSAGTVTVSGSLPPSDSHWWATAADKAGITYRTPNISVRTPAIYEVRNSSDNSLIDSVTVTGTFEYPNGSTTQRTTNTGEIDANGLPDKEYDLTLSASGYNDVAYTINDITQNGTLYMTDSSTPTVDITFQLDDQTRNFPPENSTLIAEKQVGGTWSAVKSEEWGADAEVVFTLEEGVTYRLKVRNEKGDTRIAEKYTVPSSSETVVLTLTDDAGFDTPTDDLAYTFDATMVNNDQSVRAQFMDRNNSTTNIEIVMHKHGNETPQGQIFRSTFNGPYGNLSVTESLTSYQQNWTIAVDFNATRNGENINGTVIVNEQREDLGFPLDQTILLVLVAILLVVIAGLFIGRAPEAGIAVSIVSGGLWMLGLAPETVTAPLIVGALTVSGMLYAIRGPR